jgi:hypothetical protein
LGIRELGSCCLSKDEETLAVIVREGILEEVIFWPTPKKK